LKRIVRRNGTCLAEMRPAEIVGGTPRACRQSF